MMHHSTRSQLYKLSLVRLRDENFSSAINQLNSLNSKVYKWYEMNVYATEIDIQCEVLLRRKEQDAA